MIILWIVLLMIFGGVLLALGVGLILCTIVDHNNKVKDMEERIEKIRRGQN